MDVETAREHVVTTLRIVGELAWDINLVGYMVHKEKEVGG